MARLNYKGHLVEVDDPTLVDYYRGDGATDVIDESAQVEQLPEGQAFQDDGTVKTFEPGQTVPEMTGQVIDTATGQPVEAADAAAEPQQAAPADAPAATDTAEPAQGDSAPQPGQAADPASA